jgi:predicted metal-dependent peptidase
MATKKITIGGEKAMDKLTLSHVLRHMILNPDGKTTFYAKVIQKMRRVETKEVTYAAVGVEKTGITLYYNPESVGKLSYDQLVYVLSHEILHVVFRHQQRSGGTVSTRDNVAADLAVNSILGKIDLPILFAGEGQFQKLPAGKSYEWYYMNLPDDKKDDEGGGAKGHDNFDGHKKRDGKADSCANAHVDKAVREAYSEAKKQGNMPADLESAIGEMLKPRVNWKVELRKFGGQFAQMGTRPSRKRMNRRVPIFGVVPGEVNRYTTKLLYAIDTSGSMGAKEVNAAAREMKALPIPYTMIECDAAIHGVTKMTRWKKFCGKVRGGGGTDFRPVFEYAKKGGYTGIIFVTDLYGEFPANNKIRTLWLSTVKDMKAPFGKTIFLDIE